MDDSNLIVSLKDYMAWKYNLENLLKILFIKIIKYILKLFLKDSMVFSVF